MTWQLQAQRRFREGNGKVNRDTEHFDPTISNAAGTIRNGLVAREPHKGDLNEKDSLRLFSPLEKRP